MQTGGGHQHPREPERPMKVYEGGAVLENESAECEESPGQLFKRTGLLGRCFEKVVS